MAQAYVLIAVKMSLVQVVEQKAFELANFKGVLSGFSPLHDFSWLASMP